MAQTLDTFYQGGQYIKRRQTMCTELCEEYVKKKNEPAAKWVKEKFNINFYECSLPSQMMWALRYAEDKITNATKAGEEK